MMAATAQDIQKVIIIGGGPAGLIAALHLHRYNGIKVSVFEIRKEQTTLGGAIGVPSNGLRLLYQLGLYDKAVAKGSLTSDMVFYSLNGNALGQMNLSRWSEQETGFGYLRIRRTDMMEILEEATKEAGIKVQYAKSITHIEEVGDQVTASFSDGTTETADFLLGCDGIHSAVRKLYIETTQKPRYTGISNMFSLVPIAKSELPPNMENLRNLNATVTSDGLFVITPTTPHNEVFHWFFSREIEVPQAGDVRDGWESRGSAEVEGYQSTIRQLLGSKSSQWMEFVETLMERTKDVKFYPIYSLPAGAQWLRGRCLLIGDAAHAMPPHASQGLSMALEDVFLFSRLLKTCKLPLDDALSMYVAKRRSRTDAMLKTAEQRGAVRKQTPPWRVRVNELAMSVGLSVYKLAGLERLGLGQKDWAYDVEKEVF